MIEGLKIDVTRDELLEHLNARRSYHRERREFYETQTSQLVAGGIRDTLASNDPTQSLANSAKQHGQKEGLFGFIADHLIEGETYRLTEQDLTRLEIIDRYL